MELFGMTAVASITVVAYLAGLAVKASPWNNNQLIPLVCGSVGGIFGVLGYYIHMDQFLVGDPISALAVGIVSGLSATGLNELGKQLSKDTEQNTGNTGE